MVILKSIFLSDGFPFGAKLIICSLPLSVPLLPEPHKFYNYSCTSDVGFLKSISCTSCAVKVMSCTCGQVAFDAN